MFHELALLILLFLLYELEKHSKAVLKHPPKHRKNEIISDLKHG